MQFTDRGILAFVAMSDCQEVMAVRIHLLDLWVRGEYLKQFCSMYLHWHSQPPPYCKQVMQKSHCGSDQDQDGGNG